MVVDEALAFWLAEPGRGEIRSVPLPEPAADEVLVRTVRSGISRGTESLVFAGRVPPGERETMRAPFQEGAFPGPVKYGYLSVGVVERGPADLEGRTVFCLFPHQTAYVVPAAAVVPVPESHPPGRGPASPRTGSPVPGRRRPASRCPGSARSGGCGPVPRRHRAAPAEPAGSRPCRVRQARRPGHALSSTPFPAR